MDEPRRSETVLPISLMLALAAALAGGVLLKQPLKSSRPPITEERMSAVVDPVKVQARLWEDPFRAVARHRQREKGLTQGMDQGRVDMTIMGGAEPGSAAVEAVVRSKAQHGHHPEVAGVAAMLERRKIKSITVLGVLVNGSPYSEGSESRLRHRYAVVSALDTAGYLPDDGEHIQFFTWQPSSKSECTLTKGTSLTVPFELYHPNKLRAEAPSADTVLLLWLNEDHLATAPLCLIAALKRQFEEAFEQKENFKKEEVGLHFRLIGPRTSNGLLAMLGDAGTLAKRHVRLSPGPSDRGMPLYSPWATAWHPILARELDGSTGLDSFKSIRSLFEQVGVDFIPTIDTDFVLANDLLQELKLRGVKPAKHEIALIYELDTFYGRALPLTLAALLLSQQPDENGDPTQHLVIDRAKWEEEIRVHSYLYLRGLDGELPEPGQIDEESQAEPRPAPPWTEAAVGVETLERPVGPSQLDYVRRLAEQMVREQPEGGYRAIGVLGSDVYDKLLILQAVRPFFPGATFFTTDLDARLLHRSELGWTRNLIVASGFGLSLNSGIQGDIPPFRDVYQTSVFYACLQALGHPAGTSSLVERTVAATDEPETVHARLHEIGLSGAVDLSLESSGPSAQDIHPPRPGPLPSWRIRLLAGLGIVLGVALVIPFIGVTAWLWLAGIGLLVMGAFMAVVAAAGQAGEPFAWLEGVSIWPAVLLRLTAGALSAYFIVLSCRQLRDNFQRLSEKYRLANGSSALETEPADKEGVVSVPKLWERYGEEGDWRKRVLRAGLFVVIVGGFGMMVMQILGRPANPYRGDLSLFINLLVLAPSVLFMMFLFGMILDATLLCKTRLIEPLIGKTPSWSRNLVDRDLHLSETDIPFWEQWLALVLIGEHTEVVRRLIYFPFISLSIMILSRNRLFDNFDFPPSLLTIWGVISLLAIASVWTLRMRAEALRNSVVDCLSDELARTSTFEEGRGEQLKLRIERLKQFRLGVFASPLSQPVVSAVLLGVLSVLQFFIVQE